MLSELFFCEKHHMMTKLVGLYDIYNDLYLWVPMQVSPDLLSLVCWMQQEASQKKWEKGRLWNAETAKKKRFLNEAQAFLE